MNQTNFPRRTERNAMSLPPIPTELLHLCEKEREAVRRYAEAYALQAVESLRREPMTEFQRGIMVMEYLGPEALTGGKMSVLDAFTLGIDAAEKFHHHITQKEPRIGQKD